MRRVNSYGNVHEQQSQYYMKGMPAKPYGNPYMNPNNGMPPPIANYRSNSPMGHRRMNTFSNFDSIGYNRFLF